jgi:hypothetical protein
VTLVVADADDTIRTRWVHPVPEGWFVAGAAFAHDGSLFLLLREDIRSLTACGAGVPVCSGKEFLEHLAAVDGSVRQRVEVAGPLIASGPLAVGGCSSRACVYGAGDNLAAEAGAPRQMVQLDPDSGQSSNVAGQFPDGTSDPLTWRTSAAVVIPGPDGNQSKLVDLDGGAELMAFPDDIEVTYSAAGFIGFNGTKTDSMQRTDGRRIQEINPCPDQYFVSGGPNNRFWCLEKSGLGVKDQLSLEPAGATKG